MMSPSEHERCARVRILAQGCVKKTNAALCQCHTDITDYFGFHRLISISQMRSIPQIINLISLIDYSIPNKSVESTSSVTIVKKSVESVSICDIGVGLAQRSVRIVESPGTWACLRFKDKYPHNHNKNLFYTFLATSASAPAEGNIPPTGLAASATLPLLFLNALAAA